MKMRSLNALMQKEGDGKLEDLTQKEEFLAMEGRRRWSSDAEDERKKNERETERRCGILKIGFFPFFFILFAFHFSFLPVSKPKSRLGFLGRHVSARQNAKTQNAKRKPARKVNGLRFRGRKKKSNAWWTLKIPGDSPEIPRLIVFRIPQDSREIRPRYSPI
jgi:hypothetical protein